MEFKSELSRKIFESKYMLPIDKSVEDSKNRVLSVIEQYYPDKVPLIEEALDRKEIGLGGGNWRSAMNPNIKVSSINCTTLEPPEDNLESISQAWYWWAKFAAFGQGEGIDLSLLRPRGSKLHNTANYSTGAVSFMHTFDGVLKIIAQQGRRGASLISLKIEHPDILEFISVKDEEGVLESANISIQVSDEFMKAVENKEMWTFRYSNKYETMEKEIPADKLFYLIAEHTWKSGDPGIQFADTAKRYSNSDYLGHPVFSTNACSFTGDTLVTTKEGIFPIKELVGKKHIIFDGEKWVPNNDFKVTGENQKIYRVEISSGNYFDVTAEHKFFTTEGEMKKTLELNPGDLLQYDTEASLHIGSHYEAGAYLKGFLLGDGNIVDYNSSTPRPVLWLYAPKYSCLPFIEESFDEMKTEDNLYRGTKTDFSTIEFLSSVSERRNIIGLTSKERKTLYHWASDYKEKLPVDIFNWDYNSKVNFIAGLFDADGTAMDNSHSFGYQFSSVHKYFLIDVLRLLSTIGVYGKLSIGNDKHTTTIREKESHFQKTWRITIPQKYAIGMSKLIPFQRLKSFADRKIIYSIKFRYNKVVSVTELPERADKVYCTSVPTTSRFLVHSGIITGNSEQWLDPHNVCLLASVNLSRTKDLDHLRHCVDLLTYTLDAFRLTEIKEDRSPSPIQKQKMVDLPRIGIGVTGLADYFIKRKIKYDSDEAIQEAKSIFSTLTSQAYISSYKIAKRNKKSFTFYDREKYKESPFIKRLLGEGLISDFHLDYQAHVCKTTVPPCGSLTEVVEAGGGGIEPLFAKYYVRRERATTGDWKEWCTFNHLVIQELEKLGKEVTKENVDKYLNDDYWVTSHTIDVHKKVELMSMVQRYIDSAISCTYNLPEEATVEDIQDIYMEAWKQELKGVAVFRDGCKQGVLLTDANYEKMKKKLEEDSSKRFSPKRPEIVEHEIHEVTVNKEPHIVLLGIVDGRPFEVFVTKNIDKEFNIKAFKKGFVIKKKKGHYDLIVNNGEEGKIVIEDIIKRFDTIYGTLGRFLSMSLRHQIPVEFIIDQLAKDKNFVGFEKSVGRILKKFIKEGENVQTSDVCESCGGRLIFMEGCKSCPECGWSRCE